MVDFPATTPTLSGAASSTVRMLPEAPFIGPWRITVVALAIAATAAGYVIAMARLRRAGRRWPPRRAVSFLAGLALAVIATQSGLASYDDVSFSAHVAQHLLLGMAAPALVALGAPVTLALQAANPPLRRRLVGVLHSSTAQVLSHPVLVWVVFVGSLYVLYLSPLYPLSLDNEVVHGLVHAHFVLAGALFFWLVMARDPARRSLTPAARLAMVVMTIPFHAFLGLAILSTSSPLSPMAGADALADQRLGAAIMWAGGDVVVVGAGLAVVTHWMREDERVAAREDRALHPRS